MMSIICVLYTNLTLIIVCQAIAELGKAQPKGRLKKTGWAKLQFKTKTGYGSAKVKYIELGWD